LENKVLDIVEARCNHITYVTRHLVNVLWTVHLDINFEAITNLMHKYLYLHNITILYKFRALLCSSSGGQIVYVQHLVPSLFISGRRLHWLRESSLLTSVTYGRS